MAKAQYQETLAHRLETLAIQIAKARERLDRGVPRDQAAAGADLRMLEQDYAKLQEKIDRLSREPESGWDELKASVEEDFDTLFVNIARWIVTH